MHPSLSSVARVFPPGSEWLCAKLYTGTYSADHVLREVIGPLTTEVLESRAADQWFFTRYADPAWHLRVRFHGKPERLYGDVMPAIQAVAAGLLKEGWLARVQFDTYEREVERYGGPEGILLAEQVFHVDSEAALQIIQRSEAGERGADERWRLTLLGINALLQDLGFELQAKLALVRQVRSALANELRLDGKLRGQLGERFRQERKALEALLDPRERKNPPSLLPGISILRRRSAQLAPLVAKLKEAAQAGKVTIAQSKFGASLIHMQANRLLRSAQRAHELVLYDFLARLYQSEFAREKGTPPLPEDNPEPD